MMMPTDNVIWKFPIEIEDNFSIEMPFGSRILCIQIQNNKPQIWASCTPSNSTVTRKFEVFGTGNIFPNGERIYIGSFQLNQGSLVFHVFEKF